MSTVERAYKLAKNRNVQYTTIKAAEHRGSQLTVDTIERLCEDLGITFVRLLQGRCVRKRNSGQGNQCYDM